MMHNQGLAIAGVVALLFASLPSWAQDQSDVAVLAEALPQATVLLEQGLKASHRDGTLISAKYKIEDGVLQLSVYTMSPDRFTEVIFDLGSGAIQESRAITEGENLKTAAMQGAAMSWARMSLEDVVSNALRV